MTPTDEQVKEMLEKIKEDEKLRIYRPPGFYSNTIIRQRNRGVRHQFENDIGGCSDNYR
jgi:hypothetical protein